MKEADGHEQLENSGKAHDDGRLYVQKALGSKVQTTFKENVPEGPQVAQVIESLIRAGASAFLVGESLMRQDDVESGTRALLAQQSGAERKAASA